jgi:hydroxyacylglutathione hydrolase
MLLRYFYDTKLAHASYMVGCQATHEAIIIDPGRDLEPYLKEAEAQEMCITAATETHIHADFLSGARELAERTRAKLYLSDEGDENWKYQFLDGVDHQLVKDGDTFRIGNIKFEVLHTPGHTPEHISFLITDTAGADQPMGIFSGDFVFVGDVGRPDLLEEAAGFKGTKEIGARQMFQSLQRFKALPDYVQIWPAHGAGSACGKSLGAVPSSTLGYEKLFNWALSYTDEAEFVKALLAGQPEAPKYFAMMKKLNKEGPRVLHGLPVPEHLPYNRLKQLLDERAVVVDTRPSAAFASIHIPGTINIPHDGSFVNWAGWLLDYDRPFYLIADSSRIAEIIRDLIYIGLDNAAGYFETSAIDAWAESGQSLQSYEVASPQDVADQVKNDEVTVVDVRALSEWDEGHLPGAQHIMLGYLPERMSEIPTAKPVVVQCLSGNRSAIGASILQTNGFGRVINLIGGYRDWAAAGLPIERNSEVNELDTPVAA